MDPLHAQIAALIKQNLPQRAIAQRVGVSQPRVSQIARSIADSGVDLDQKMIDLPPDLRWASSALSVAREVAIRMDHEYKVPNYVDSEVCALSGDTLGPYSRVDFTALLPLFPDAGYKTCITVHPTIAAFFARYTPEQAVGIIKKYVAMRRDAQPDDPS